MKSNFRNTKKYKRWTKKIVKKAGKCLLCNEKDNLHAHHLNSAEYFPEERFLLENGVCLCKKCHTNYHTNYNRSFRVKTTKKNFINFLTLVIYLKTLEDSKKGNICLEQLELFIASH